MLKGGVIMDVVTADQAKIAEDAGAVAVMALERVPADIRAQGGVARMSDPDLIDGIIAAVSIPVMAKARIGHFVEAQILQELGVDYIDESEVLSPADYVNHIDKHGFTVPFVCGATNLGEALRRITEGAAMIRSKGEAGTGDVSEATKHIRTILGEINALKSKTKDELYVAAKELQAPYELVAEIAATGKAAGRAVHGWRRCDSCRRGSDDARRCRWRLRRLGNLQSGKPGGACRGHREGHDVLRRPGWSSRRRREASVRRWSASTSPTSPLRTASPIVAGSAPRVGVLALQGDFREHLTVLRMLGANAVPVRRATELDDVAGLVIPGGESSVMDKLSRAFGLADPVKQRIAAGMPVYGTCAGLIMLADTVRDAIAGQQTFGGFDIVVRRNAFGNQNDSFETDLDIPQWGLRRCTRSSSVPPPSNPSARRPAP